MYRCACACHALLCGHEPRSSVRSGLCACMWLVEDCSVCTGHRIHRTQIAHCVCVCVCVCVTALCAQVIVSTDVLARGVDLDRINLVVDLDLPVSGVEHMRIQAQSLCMPRACLGMEMLTFARGCCCGCTLILALRHAHWSAYTYESTRCVCVCTDRA